MSNVWSISSVWGVLVTIAAFAAGTVINRRFGKALLNPLLLGTLFVILFLRLSGVPYSEYRSSSSLIQYLLLPATVSLAIPLYERWKQFEENITAVLTGILAGVLTSLGSITVLALALKLDHAQYITLLPKSVTTAISMDIAAQLGGIPSLTSVVVILTGIVGNLMAVSVCRWFRITDPVAKGIAIGTSSHAIGTSKALELGTTEGAMSSLSITVSGVLTSVLCPVIASFAAI